MSLRPGLELPNWTPYPTGDSFTVAAAIFLRTFRRGVQVIMSSMQALHFALPQKPIALVILRMHDLKVKSGVVLLLHAHAYT